MLFLRLRRYVSCLSAVHPFWHLLRSTLLHFKWSILHFFSDLFCLSCVVAVLRLRSRSGICSSIIFLTAILAYSGNHNVQARFNLLSMVLEAFSDFARSALFQQYISGSLSDQKSSRVITLSYFCLPRYCWLYIFRLLVVGKWNNWLHKRSTSQKKTNDARRCMHNDTCNTCMKVIEVSTCS